MHQIARAQRTGHLSAAEVLEQQVSRVIADHQLFHHRDRVLIGVSGGVDSVALLQLLVRARPSWDLTLQIVHVDHQLRPSSRDDARFVESLGTQLDVPVTIASYDVKTMCRAHSWSLEDGARRIRYQCFLEAAQRLSAHAIALAHTADDQAETVLLRLLRGSGLTGVGGMRYQRKLESLWVVRPLLGVWREELVDYVAHAHLSFRQDPSNADRAFVRNRIRHDLLPLLARDYNPKIRSALAQFAEQVQEDAACLETMTSRQWKRLVKPMAHARGVSVPIRPFLRQPKALQRLLIRRAIRHLKGELTRIEFRHWCEVERLFVDRRSGTLVDLPGGVRFARERDHVICQMVNGYQLQDPSLTPPFEDKTLGE